MKCSRTVCPEEGADCRHSMDGRMYCSFCAVKINRFHPEYPMGLVLIPTDKGGKMETPSANHWFEQLPAGCDVVEKRVGKNSLYVATVDGVPGVVCWSINTHPNAQRKLDEMVALTLRRKSATRAYGDNESVLVRKTDGTWDSGFVNYVHMDHLNDFKTTAAISVKLVSQHARANYSGSVYPPESVWPMDAKFFLFRPNDSEPLVGPTGFNECWLEIHKRSNGASVDWQLKNEGWRIVPQEEVV